MVLRGGRRTLASIRWLIFALSTVFSASPHTMPKPSYMPTGYSSNKAFMPEKESIADMSKPRADGVILDVSDNNVNQGLILLENQSDCQKDKTAAQHIEAGKRALTWLKSNLKWPKRMDRAADGAVNSGILEEKALDRALADPANENADLVLETQETENKLGENQNDDIDIAIATSTSTEPAIDLHPVNSGVADTAKRNADHLVVEKPKATLVIEPTTSAQGESARHYRIEGKEGKSAAMEYLAREKQKLQEKYLEQQKMQERMRDEERQRERARERDRERDRIRLAKEKERERERRQEADRRSAFHDMTRDPRDRTCIIPTDEELKEMEAENERFLCLDLCLCARACVHVCISKLIRSVARDVGCIWLVCTFLCRRICTSIDASVHAHVPTRNEGISMHA
jgi:hypothetical protein